MDARLVCGLVLRYLSRRVRRRLCVIGVCAATQCRTAVAEAWSRCSQHTSAEQQRTREQCRETEGSLHSSPLQGELVGDASVRRSHDFRTQEGSESRFLMHTNGKHKANALAGESARYDGLTFGALGETDRESRGRKKPVMRLCSSNAGPNSPLSRFSSRSAFQLKSASIMRNPTIAA